MLGLTSNLTRCRWNTKIFGIIMESTHRLSNYLFRQIIIFNNIKNPKGLPKDNWSKYFWVGHGKSSNNGSRSGWTIRQWDFYWLKTPPVPSVSSPWQIRGISFEPFPRYQEVLQKQLGPAVWHLFREMVSVWNLMRSPNRRPTPANTAYLLDQLLRLLWFIHKPLLIQCLFIMHSTITSFQFNIYLKA